MSFSWESAPALALAGCFAGGIALANALPHVLFWWWTGGSAAGLLFVCGTLVWPRHRLVTPLPLFRTLVLALLVGAAGGARASQEASFAPHHLVHLLPHLEDRTVALYGRMVADPVVLSYGQRGTLSLTAITAGGDSMAAAGRVQILLGQPHRGSVQRYPRLRAGDQLRLQGRLRPLPRKRNPADFDYGSYLARRGIYGRFSLYDAEGVRVTGRGGEKGFLPISPARRYIRTQLARYLPTERGRMVLSALLLGDRSTFHPEMREQFARTGLMHLLAVSGLHVLLVGMVLYGLLRPLLMRMGLGWYPVEMSRSLATLFLLGLYTLLTGAPASAVRASVMAALFMGGALLQRPVRPLNTLGSAALLLLLVQPSQLYEVGFQLSFSAVGGLVLWTPRFVRAFPERWQTGMRRSIVDLLSTSGAATLGTLPVLLAHFGRAPLAGLVLNLTAIPCTLLTLASGLAAVVLAGYPPAGAAFGAAADGLARVLLWTADRGDRWLGGIAAEKYVDSPWLLLALTAAVVTLSLGPRLRWKGLACVLLLLNLEIWIGVAGGHYRPHLEVLFFDVGQGDAALVTLPNGRHLLVDAGPRDAFSDGGTRTILPHLARYGITRLDAVVITHPHRDHLGGLPALLRTVPIHRVIHNGENYSSALFAETSGLIDSLGIRQQAVRAGDTLYLDPTVRIQVLSPAAGAGSTPNDASVVLRIAYGKTSLLLTGDAEAEAERRMLTRYGGLVASEVVKVGHHGSRTSSTLPFVRQVLRPHATAVVSVARTNRFGLPSPEVLDRWRNEGATVETTAAEGAVWMRSDGTRYRRRLWR